MTFAAGLSTEGLKPVCAIYSTFLQRAFDQLVHDVCIQDLNVKFCLDRGGSPAVMARRIMAARYCLSTRRTQHRSDGAER